MEAIHNNPFRILGLPIDATVREISKRTSDLEMYAEMGKPKTYDTDFSCFSPVERTLDAVRVAANQIETDDSRFFYSMFWFWNNNSADDLAEELLQEGKIQKAIVILEKHLSRVKTPEKALSTIKNLSILHLASARSSGGFSSHDFSQGLVWAGTFLQNTGTSLHANTNTNDHFYLDMDKMGKLYVDEILKSISAGKRNYDGQFTPQQIIAGFSRFPDSLRKLASSNLLKNDFRTIEEAIQQSQQGRKQDPHMANDIAHTLCQIAKEPIVTIRNALGSDDYTYQSLSDKLAEEIDCCGTTYYNYHTENDTGTDPGDITLKISKYALKYAISINVQDNIKEGILIVEQWIQGADDRKHKKEIEPHLDIIITGLDNLPDVEILDQLKTDNPPQIVRIPSTVESFLNLTVPHLDKLSSLNSELHIQFSSAVAHAAITLCICYVNHTHDSKRVRHLMDKIGRIEMNANLRDYFERNHAIVKENCRIEQETLRQITQRSNSPQAKSGCYIATMVYGDYDAPQVLVLRKYRDQVMSKSCVGRLFIKCYYLASPVFVKHFGHVKYIHSPIRAVLDHIVRRLS